MTAFQALSAWRPKPDTDAASLRSSLAEATAALATARGRAAALEAARGDTLLDANPSDVAAHEAQLADAMAEAGRLAAMCAALPARIAAAEARERAAELDTLAAATEALAEEGAALLPKIVRDLHAVAALMRQHDDIAAKVLAASAELHGGGRARVALPMRRAWPDPGNTSPISFGFDAVNMASGRSVFSRPAAPGFDTAPAQGSLAIWLASKTG